MTTETSAPPEVPSVPKIQRAQWQSPELTKINAGSAELAGGSGGDNDVFS